MRKTLKALPIIIYPYVYMICLGIYFLIVTHSADVEKTTVASIIALAAAALVYNAYSFFAAFYLIFAAAKGKYGASGLSKLNMTVKLVQIPAYIIHFALALIGFLMSVWGIPVIIWAIVIDFVSISLSGIVGVAASIAGRKESALTTAQSVWFAIGGFVYCVDVAIAIVMRVIVKRKTKVD